jgi:type VI secretion system ImpM family protein
MGAREAFYRAIRRIGYFGKVPSVGDFVFRNVASGLREGFDDWLQHALEASRSQMKDGWLNAFLTSPVWRLVLDRQYESDPLTVGIMIPSVDKVGRYFPFCIFIQMDRMELDAAFIAECDLALDSLEDFILSVLEADFDLEYFDYQLAAVAKKLMSADGGGLAHILGVDQGKILTSFFAPDKSAVLNSRLSALKTQGGSIWWTNGSDHRIADIHFYDAMPTPSTYAAFLRDPNAFSDLDLAWDHMRDLGVSQSDNPSVDFGGSGTGFSYHAIAHHGRNQTTNTGYAAPFFDPVATKSLSGVILSNGQFGFETYAMVARFVCRKLPYFLSAGADTVLDPEHVERLSAFLQLKFHTSQMAGSTTPFGFCCAYIPTNFAPASERAQRVHITATNDFVCFHIRNHELVAVFENEVQADGPTIRHAKDNFYKSIILNPRVGDRILIANFVATFADLANILVDRAGYPSPQDAARSIMQDTMISGKQGNILVSVLDF